MVGRPKKEYDPIFRSLFLSIDDNHKFDNGIKIDIKRLN